MAQKKVVKNTEAAKKAGKRTTTVKKPVKRSKSRKAETSIEYSTTIYDDTYHSILSLAPWFIIPVINDAFKTRYRKDVKIERLKNEFYRENGKLITDSIFLIEGHLYHIEVQSSPDKTMSIRMFEYGVEIALEQARKDKDYLHVKLPESAVIYLRHNDDTPDVLKVEVSAPNGKSLIYESKVIKLQDYTKDAIFRKKLLLLLPFYIMRYENEIDEIERDSARRAKFKKECESVIEKLWKVLEENGEPELYPDLVGYILNIIDYMLRTKKNARKEMSEMGGKILETFSEKKAREGKKELTAAMKDIVNGVKPAELRKKYNSETIKMAKDSIKLVKTTA